MKKTATAWTAFWPVYKALKAELKTLGDQPLAVIQDLAEHFNLISLTISSEIPLVY